jgi:hypothetical protein
MLRLPAALLARLALLLILFAGPHFLWAAPSVGPDNRLFTGIYSDEQLAGIKSFSLPRTFLYDRSGALITQEHWPSELREFKKHAGEGFCCVSDTAQPSGSSGPPPDCKIIVYGTDVRESFKGLLSPSGQAITYESLPKHKYLLVEYYATWCAPCVTGRKALESFFNSASQAKDYVWVTIDMSRLQDVQQAKKKTP